MSADASSAARRGLVGALVLIGLAILVPLVTGWSVHATAHSPGTVAPLHATWRPMVGTGTPFAILLGLLGICYARSIAARLRWSRLLAATYATSLAWAVALAMVYGQSGLSRDLDSPAEYLITARRVQDVPATLHGFIARIPLHSPHAWPIHVAGHPPGVLLFFVALVHLGLGSSLAAGCVVTLIGTTTPVAVLVTLRHLGAESAARRCAPFLLLGPAALWVAVSGDSVFAAVAAWGLAALTCACTASANATRWVCAVVAGLLLGLLPMLSYGLVLLAPLALSVLVVTRGWRVLPVVAVVAVLPVLVFAGLGFAWWEAYPVLTRRYWDGLAHSRPAAYWVWADLASLILSAGPALGAGLATLVVERRRTERAVVALVTAAAGAVVLADVSLMSKGEVERIWLPFVPWLLVSTAALPDRWRRPALVIQVVTALLIEHLLDTGW